MACTRCTRASRSAHSAKAKSSPKGGKGKGAAGEAEAFDPFVPLAKRKVIVVSGRVHPGETCASWMVEGLLTFITSEHPVARKLRRSTIFKVVPCMNPDGVINGNYRVSFFSMLWTRSICSIRILLTIGLDPPSQI